MRCIHFPVRLDSLKALFMGCSNVKSATIIHISIRRQLLVSNVSLITFASWALRLKSLV
jgi:hypothetical protein